MSRVFAQGGEGGEEQHPEGLPELLHQGAGGEEHAFLLDPAGQGIVLGDVCQDGIWENAQERERQGKADHDQVGLQLRV